MIPNCKKEKMITVFEGKIFSGVETSLDLTKYKYLYITCAIYDAVYPNTAGASGVLVLDLTKQSATNHNYSVSMSCAYGVFYDTLPTINPMQVGVVVNSAKTTITPKFVYENTPIPSSSKFYYISKIVGIK